jgi:hypothetical protein
MSVTPSLTQFVQLPANEPAILILQVMVILAGVILLMQAEFLAVGRPRSKGSAFGFYLGVVPLLIMFVVTVVARFLRIIF